MERAMIFSSVGDRSDTSLAFSSFDSGFPGNKFGDLVSPRFLTSAVGMSEGSYTLLHGVWIDADSKVFGSSPVSALYSAGLQ